MHPKPMEVGGMLMYDCLSNCVSVLTLPGTVIVKISLLNVVTPEHWPKATKRIKKQSNRKQLLIFTKIFCTVMIEQTQGLDQIEIVPLKCLYVCLC